ncbi:MAG: ABC transporter substrate binding protein [Candidatus Thiodiazotropha sp.]
MRNSNSLFSSLVLVLFFLFSASTWSAPFRVLVVMSYEQDNPWCLEIKQGIDRVLAAHAELTYFYMNTKKNLSQGPEKAKEAKALFDRLNPDGVITVDDNAQSMFVVPYLKDKVDTPIFFCGVNGNAADYGYPNQHISGTLERGHIRESIAFLKQLLPEFDNLCFIAKASPSGDALKKQVEGEKSTYMVSTPHFELVTTTRQLREFTDAHGQQCGAFYMDSLEGIVNERNEPMDNREILDFFRSNYSGPIIGGNRYHVEDGAVSAVVKTGQEQGEIAADMLLQALQGKPVSELPVTRNYKGRRYININSLQSLGIKPRPIVLRGATLVTTTDR